VLGAPVMALVLLVNVALGVYARIVPQFNIFVVGFVFTIGMGLIALLFTLPLLPAALERSVRDLFVQLLNVLKV